MTHIEQAIREAKENGWDDGNVAFFSETKHDDSWLVDGWQYDNKAFLDPLFWQALGKARGWGECHVCGCKVFTNSVCDNCRDTIVKHPDDWKDEWHRFIDHLAEGKDAESFFKDLLSDTTRQ